MASDLAGTPTSGIRVQVCGDAHLSNFGMFGSPERHLFFDVNDFDETAPGPWEWDVKRLAASLEIAGRDHDFSAKRRATIVQLSVRAYREAMREFAGRVDARRLVLAPRHGRAVCRGFRMLLDPKRTPERVERDHQGPRARQPSGIRQACARSRPDRRVSCTTRRSSFPSTTTSPRPTRRGPRIVASHSRCVPAHARSRPAPARRPVPRRAHRAEGRGCGERRHRGVDHAVARSHARHSAPAPDQTGGSVGARAVHGEERCSRTTVIGWSRASASCRPPATSSSAGNGSRARATRVTTTCASCATGRAPPTSPG